MVWTGHQLSDTKTPRTNGMQLQYKQLALHMQQHNTSSTGSKPQEVAKRMFVVQPHVSNTTTLLANKHACSIGYCQQGHMISEASYASLGDAHALPQLRVRGIVTMAGVAMRPAKPQHRDDLHRALNGYDDSCTDLGKAPCT